MTRKRDNIKTGAKSTPAARSKTQVEFDRLLPACEIWGLVLAATGGITLIALTTSSQGRLSLAWSNLLRQVFGVGAYAVAALLVVGGLLLLLHKSLPKPPTLRWQAIVGWEIVFFVGLGLVHVLTPVSAYELARSGRGGGYFGWAWVQFLVPLLGKTIAVILLLVFWLFGWFLAIGRPWRVVLWRLRWAVSGLGLGARHLFVGHGAPSPEAPRARTTPPIMRPRPQTASPTSTTGQPSAKRKARSERLAPRLKVQAELGKLPSLELLVPDTIETANETDNRARAEIIEKTLDAFGVPATVVEWHRGPVVTQFGIEPGFIERTDRSGDARRFKIRVSKILSLQNDLALALAASPIRIEAPVPGRPFVGIEVPNAVKSMVGLHGVLSSPECHKMHSNLRFALGRDVSGEPVVGDLAKMPHLLIAGATGSGKSVCLNAVIASFLFHNQPDELKLVMVDPKRVELTKYNGIPHLVAPVIVDIPKVIVALRWLTREMEERYRLFAAAGARHLAAYNKRAKSRGLEPLPNMVVIIDELADLMLAAPDDIETTVCRLAQMARATGIHLVIATQRPSVDVVTGLIKANFPARISFAVTSQIDSRVILDTPGAEKLLGRGDMLFMAPDSPKLQRIQGCFVSEPEIDDLVAYWKQMAAQESDLVLRPAPWVGMSLEDDPSGDDLMQRAIDLVREHEQASASFLQRRLRIGYPRAARLIDELEDLGVVGPAETGGKSREVLPLGEEGEELVGDDGMGGGD
jgi:S-DNA-T family DNA segregation ATPase FtsK/SpoIIIE